MSSKKDEDWYEGISSIEEALRKGMEEFGEVDQKVVLKSLLQKSQEDSYGEEIKALREGRHLCR
ncbi:Hypothetical protein FKW44_015692 [Caligus rogercresseyi]|uniref:Uncharacterized protein n=1 Tax=Caligus rogercresseyi TaxID=217165 RepID=A0A7T8K0U0_CALRO|nr:Hypothetical protein FKW44_015692 [Caligus rogercresseyi]